MIVISSKSDVSSSEEEKMEEVEDAREEVLIVLEEMREQNSSSVVGRAKQRYFSCLFLLPTEVKLKYKSKVLYCECKKKIKQAGTGPSSAQLGFELKQLCVSGGELWNSVPHIQSFL